MTQGKKRKRKLSKRRRAVYRRRRIVVGIALVLAVALTVFCVYSLGRGMAAIDTTIRHDDLMALSRKAVPALVRCVRAAL